MRIHSALLTVYVLLILSYLVCPSSAFPGDAEVARKKNLQNLQLEPGDVDFIRHQNLQYFELEPNHADVIRYYNLQYFQLEPNNADVIRYKNLQYFELAPVESLVINIGPITTTDQEGNPKTTFNPGDIIEVWFVVENVGNLTLKRGLISALILDPSNTPIFLSYTLEDLTSGASKKFIMGYGIPLGATVGNYTIKVMVFTDWPSKGGIGLDIETSTFVVS